MGGCGPDFSQFVSHDLLPGSEVLLGAGGSASKVAGRLGLAVSRWLPFPPRGPLLWAA